MKPAIDDDVDVDALDRHTAIVVLRAPANACQRVRIEHSHQDEQLAHQAARIAASAWLRGSDRTHATVRAYVRTVVGWRGPLTVVVEQTVSSKVVTTSARQLMDARAREQLELELASVHAARREA